MPSKRFRCASVNHGATAIMAIFWVNLTNEQTVKQTRYIEAAFTGITQSGAPRQTSNGKKNKQEIEQEGERMRKKEQERKRKQQRRTIEGISSATARMPKTIPAHMPVRLTQNMLYKNHCIDRNMPNKSAALEIETFVEWASRSEIHWRLWKMWIQWKYSPSSDHRRIFQKNPVMFGMCEAWIEWSVPLLLSPSREREINSTQNIANGEISLYAIPSLINICVAIQWELPHR